MIINRKINGKIKFTLIRKNLEQTNNMALFT